MNNFMRVVQNTLRSGRNRCCHLAISLLLAIATESYAADRFWGKTSGGTFSTPANWQGGIVPGSNDVAHFGITNSNLFASLIRSPSPPTPPTIRS